MNDSYGLNFLGEEEAAMFKGAVDQATTKLRAPRTSFVFFFTSPFLVCFLNFIILVLRGKGGRDEERKGEEERRGGSGQARS